MNIKSKMILGVSLFAMTFSFETTAQTCKTMPTCAELGYTATSCSGDSLKCPFDTSKLYCVETCTEPCEVGSIYYSDDTCSKSVLSSKTPIGIVFDKDRKLVVSLESVTTTWNDNSSNWKDIPGLTTYSQGNVGQDVNGKSNTDTIVAFAKSSGQVYRAAQYCHDKTTGGKTWYLPAVGEMWAMRTNYSIIKAPLSKVGTGSLDGFHWSSDKYYDSSAWVLTPNTTYLTTYGQNNNFLVRCIFAY